MFDLLTQNEAGVLPIPVVPLVAQHESYSMATLPPCTNYNLEQPLPSEVALGQTQELPPKIPPTK